MEQVKTYSQVDNRLDRETEKAVWAMIRDSGEMKTKKIRDHLGAGIYPAIEKLETMGAIEKIQRGLYKVKKGVTK